MLENSHDVSHLRADFTLHLSLQLQEIVGAFGLHVSDLGDLDVHDPHSAFDINVGVVFILLITLVSAEVKELTSVISEARNASLEKTDEALNLEKELGSLHAIHGNSLLQNDRELLRDNSDQKIQHDNHIEVEGQEVHEEGGSGADVNAVLACSQQGDLIFQNLVEFNELRALLVVLLG